MTGISSNYAFNAAIAVFSPFVVRIATLFSWIWAELLDLLEEMLVKKVIA